MEQFRDARGEWANRSNEAGGRAPFSGWTTRRRATSWLAWAIAAAIAVGWFADAVSDQIEAEARSPAAEYVR